ncbi:MAG: cytochrome P450, partial [Geminicoccaceae bacterium]
IGTWPRRAYEEAVFERPFFGRRTMLLNAPEAVRHVLVEARERYGRTPATLRLLQPLLGQGLLLSEGDAWRHQRRTLAPAFAPRAIALLVPHMQAATAEALDGLVADEPLDLLAITQALALEIAGRTMVSLGMGQYRVTLRDRIDRYGRSGAPTLLDIMLPPRVPTPRDLSRRWHGRHWMALIGRIVATRQYERRPDLPQDLLDLLLAARDPETGRGFTPKEVVLGSDRYGERFWNRFRRAEEQPSSPQRPRMPVEPEPSSPAVPVTLPETLAPAVTAHPSTGPMLRASRYAR